MYSHANSLSSGVKNLAFARLSGKDTAEKMPIKTVAMPSRIKIQRHPARPPFPSILMMAVASRPPKAPDNEARKTVKDDVLMKGTTTCQMHRITQPCEMNSVSVQSWEY